ncbi:MAG: hypothetical protein HYZ14_18415 [Bacteroidetes bacterium]|nr:hypothetical protein [Bacteroidota bacterium]
MFSIRFCILSIISLLFSVAKGIEHQVVVFENIGFCDLNGDNELLLGDRILTEVDYRTLSPFIKDSTYTELDNAHLYDENWREGKNNVIFDCKDSLDLDLLVTIIEACTKKLLFLNNRLFYNYDISNRAKSLLPGSLQIRIYDETGKLSHHYYSEGIVNTTKWMHYLAEKSTLIPALKTWGMDKFLIGTAELLQESCIGE